MSENLRLDRDEFLEAGFVEFKAALSLDVIGTLIEEWEAFEARPEIESELPMDTPVAVMWRHIYGETKRTRRLAEFPVLESVARGPLLSGIAHQVAEIYGQDPNQTRLLETIVFNKPPSKGGVLNWHQDVSYFPFTPNNQVAVWIPFDSVNEQNGTLKYARGSHKAGLRGSTNLHTGEMFENEDRPLIPEDPAAAGYEVHTLNFEPGDFSLHDGGVWHTSSANVTSDRPRRALSVRFLIGETRYTPRPGSAASFIKQVDIKPGDIIASEAFPLV